MNRVCYGLREIASKDRRECMDWCRIDVLEELGRYVATKFWLEPGRYIATELWHELRLSEQPETEKSKFGGRTKNKKKKKKRNVHADFLLLVPLQCQQGSLEYRVRCRGGSEPFTKVRVLCDPELREKGEVSARAFINCIVGVKIGHDRINAAT